MPGYGEKPTTMYGLGLNQSTLPGGEQLGDKLTVYDFANNGFKEVMLVQAYGSASVSLSANSVLKFISKGVVDMVSTAGDMVAGVNDVSSIGTANGAVGTGAIVAAGNYFYMTIRGAAKPLLDAGVAAGPLETGSVTAGQLKAWATTAGATFQQTNLISLAASGAGGATNAFIF